MPILSFADRDTERLFRGERVRRCPPDVRPRAATRIAQIEAADALADLAALPGLEFEKLRHDRAGQYSVRVNRQWRVCFRWDGGAHDVEFTDYH